jgi:hypothetical protein
LYAKSGKQNRMQEEKFLSAEQNTGKTVFLCVFASDVFVSMPKLGRNSLFITSRDNSRLNNFTFAEIFNALEFIRMRMILSGSQCSASCKIAIQGSSAEFSVLN